MFKKKMKQLLSIVLILSLLIPTAFALESTSYQEDKQVEVVQALATEAYLSQQSLTVGQAAYQHVVFLTEEIGTRVAASVYEEEARDYIFDVFVDLGYNPEIQDFSYTNNKGTIYDSANVIAIKPGQSSEEIIVGAHYDSVVAIDEDKGMEATGADDNASGVGVMLEVAEMLQDIDTEYTIRFIAFGAEEVGLRGSRHYANQMTEEEIANTVAMINLDSLIAGDKMYVYGDLGENGWVREQALGIAALLNLDVETNPGLNPDYPKGTTGDWSDHAPFRQLGIPYTYFEATNWEIGGLDGYTQTKEEGVIFHTEKDNLAFITEAFPGRVEKHLETFTRLLYQLIVDLDPTYGISVDTTSLSMTEPREVEVVINLGYEPNLKDLAWTFEDKPFEEWKQFDVATGGYTGEPFITFTEEPYIEDGLIKAIIKFDYLYPYFLDARGNQHGGSDLSNRTVRVRYPELIGEYDLTVEDMATGVATTAYTPLKLNVYDSYHTWDEMKPAIDRIFAEAKEGLYLEYKSLGESVEGREIPFVILAKDEASVNQYLNTTLPEMLNNPAALQEKIASGIMRDYKVPIWVHNIHPDESPGIDAQIELLEKFTTEDTISYLMTDTNGEEYEVIIDVEEALEHIILVFAVTQNPDGRYHNTRGNVLGFDLNRDNGYQTQIETQAVIEEIAKWTPISFLDLHGFVGGFLIEPCTPPHDPNYEYDLLMAGSLEQAHRMGNAGVANTKYESYLIPLEDWGDGWDDATPAYTATYALHHGSMAHTIEMPELNEDSHIAMVHTVLASVSFVMEEKDRLFMNQLEYFRRGVDGEDNRDVDSWFVNAAGEVIGRPRGENENFFPEYYVLPVEGSLQKNVLEAHKMVEYLLRNGIKVERTTTEVVIGDIAYPAGTYVVPMRQAKRGLANTVLYDGSDFSDWGAMYAEVVNNFPALRGFDSYEIRVEGAFDGKTQGVTTPATPTTVVTENAEAYIVKNANNDTVKAINQLLNNNQKVEMIIESGDGYEAGDFVIAKEALNSLKDNYYLEVIPHTDEVATEELQKPKIAAYGYQANFVLNQLGFAIVSLEEADVIVDDASRANDASVKRAIESGKHYIGIGGGTIDSMVNSGLLPGLELGRTRASHEGLLKANVKENSIITGGYDAEELLYSATGAWMEAVPDTAKVIATISDEDDFFVAGWWPGNEGARGKTFAITDTVGDAKITIFANNITNRAHPQHQFRMLSNAIYYSMLEIVEEDEEEEMPPGGGSGGGSRRSSSSRTTPSTSTTTTIKASSGGTVKEGSVSITLPANAIGKDVKITIEKIQNISKLPIASNMIFAGDVFEITKDIAGNFDKPVTITLPFDKSKVNLDKYTLAIFWLNERTNEWIELDNVKVNSNAATVSGDIDHFTKFAVLAVEKPAVALSDIRSHWAEENIKKLVSVGAIQGYTDGTFKPNNNITRAEFATVLVKAFGLEGNNGKIFNDTANHWARESIAIAAEHGIVTGYNDTTFGPNDLITREQMAVMIVRAAKLKATNTDAGFTDSSGVSDWAIESVNTAAVKGIINGYTDNSFRPQGHATRAEAVTVIVNALQ